MSSQLPPAASKLANSSGQLSSAAASAQNNSPASTGSFDSAQRRAGGSGSFGAGAATRAGGGNAAGPRGKQAAKAHHKQSKRYKFVDEDAFAESAAMNSARNRKGQTSITHLMNFSLPPRPTYQSHYLNHRHQQRRNPTWGLGSGYHAVDKARYVHANYRFIVDPRGNYSAQRVDADVYLDWSSIFQILASPVSQAASCPICLGDPVAPRMAKCGHIFCLHCLIRYMHSTDDEHHSHEKKARWKTCPICWDSIYISETRPVRWYEGQEREPPREGGDIVLRLVLRSAGSTLALPKDGAVALAKDDDIPWHFAADVMDFARVMKGTESYMTEQFDDEISQLEQLEKHDELMFGEDSEWTSRAIRAVKEAKERVKGIGNASDFPTRIETNPETDGEQQNAVSASPVTSALSQSLAQVRANQSSHHHLSDYYFYQALLHYYLSPLDIRILKAAFGDYSLFPSNILPRVERLSTGHVVDSELRKRAKYLAHLPYGCEVCFLECDWTDTVPTEILEKFKPEIERRRKRNHEKDAREEKERLRAEREEDEKRWAATRRRRSSSENARFTAGDFHPLSGSVSTPPADMSMESSSPPWGSTRKGASFATLASPSSSPNQSRTVWGTAAITSSSPQLAPALPEPAAADDGWLQGWEKDLLREDELVTQLEAFGLNGESSTATMAATPTTSSPHPGSGKKKKGKKITLMTTNARRQA